jgi:hypothetical protein
MHMIVRAVLVRVIVPVVPRFCGVLMAVFMLVAVLVGVGMLVGVRVLRFPMPVFMRMGVNMFMGMQMLVFMIPLHCELLSFGVDVS